MALQPKQDVFDHVLVRPASDGSGLTRLSWRAARQGARIVQVYVDRVLYDVAADVTARAMWLHLDPTRGHTVELLAVDPNERWQARGDQLGGWSPTMKRTAVVELVRDESLPLDSRVAVRVDGQLVTDAPLWADGDHRAGFGGLHGQGLFGFDQATAAGHGMGSLGYGGFGFGGEAWRWAALLPGGVHTLEIQHGLTIETTQVVVSDIGEPVNPAVSVGETTVLHW